MDFNLRTTNLSALNSLTKYPSIQTYHTLDPKNGGLLESAMPFSGLVLGTEKVDGTNTRIIIMPDQTYLLGSREELLYARGDLIGNPSLGIVEALKDLAERLCELISDPTAIIVLYGELYGGKISGASKQYTGEKQVGMRLFDSLRITDYAALLARPIQEISGWREAGHQPFVSEAALQELADTYQLELTPRILTLDAADLPGTIDEAYAWIKQHMPHSRCVLDPGAGGQPEGLVIRSADRSTIAKLRFEDYARTMKRRR